MIGLPLVWWDLEGYPKVFLGCGVGNVLFLPPPLFSFPFTDAPAAYGSSWARGQMGAAAAGYVFSTQQQQ